MNRHTSRRRIRQSARLLSLSTCALVAVMLFMCGRAEAQTFTSTLVSTSGPGGVSGNANSSAPQISADGRFIAFGSSASNLVSGDSNRTGDVFLHDTQTGTTVLVSVNAAGTGSGNGLSHAPKISADSRYVTFLSFATNLVANDTNGTVADVFVRDMQTGTTTLVSINTSGAGSANNTSREPIMTPDGRFVAFASSATDLTTIPTSGRDNIYVRDLVAATTTLVSIDHTGSSDANGFSFSPAISDNGRVVAFLSTASDLTTVFVDATNIYARDLVAGTTTLVSFNASGTAGVAIEFTQPPSISADGHLIAFASPASNIVADDTNGVPDAFLRNLTTGVTTRLSFDIPPDPTTQATFDGTRKVTLSPDGRYAFFDVRIKTTTTNFGSVLSKTNAGVRRRDLLSGDVASVPSEPLCLFEPSPTCFENIEGISISADGRYAVHSKGSIEGLSRSGRTIVSDFLNSTSRTLLTPTNETNPLPATPVISADGRHIVVSTVQSFAPNDTNSNADIYRLTPITGGGQLNFDQATISVPEEETTRSVTITRANAFGDVAPVTVDFATSDDLARAGSDYTAVTGRLTFNVGDTRKSITLSIHDDEVFEGNETFKLTLGNVSGATLPPFPVHSTIIVDNERLRFSSSDVAVVEGNSGHTPAVFEVKLLVAIERPLLVFFAARNGSATSNADFLQSVSPLSFQPGETSRTATVNVVGDTAHEPDETFLLEVSNLSTVIATGTILNDDTPTVQLAAATASAQESAHSVAVTLTRAGDPSVPFSVSYATADGTASERTDYVAAQGRLDFAAGEVSKTVGVLLTDDTYIETPETFTFTLSDPSTPAALGNWTSATLTITSEDTNETVNPIDGAQFFVRQQYADFLSRLPDNPGLAFWTNEYNSLVSGCDSRPAGTERQKCVLGVRAQVSTAFFLSIEFQQTGYFIIRLYQTSFGRLPTLREFLADAQQVGRGVIVGEEGWQAKLEINRQSFAQGWINRQDFRAAFDPLSNSSYVSTLVLNGSGDASAEPALQQSLIAGLGSTPATETRATALRKIVDSRSVYNAQYNRALVLMQYFGYLRRNPQDSPDSDLSGFNFWLGKLNGFSTAGEDVRDANTVLARIRRAQMLESFLDSGEYRHRFGPR